MKLSWPAFLAGFLTVIVLFINAGCQDRLTLKQREAIEFMKYFPDRCMRFNDQWITKEGQPVRKLEEFPCKVSDDYRPQNR